MSLLILIALAAVLYVLYQGVAKPMIEARDARRAIDPYWKVEIDHREDGSKAVCVSQGSQQEVITEIPAGLPSWQLEDRILTAETDAEEVAAVYNRAFDRAARRPKTLGGDR